MSFIVLFGIIYEFHCTISINFYFLLLSTIFSIKNFQFQQNKWIQNKSIVSLIILKNKTSVIF